MKRREMLSMFALGTTPFIFNKSYGYSFFKSKDNGEAADMKRFGDGRDWFFEKRFGMFVHWGIYSIPAWHEQYQWRAKMPRAEYVKFAEEFNPKKFDPEKWLDLLQEAGMEYITFTTKHHDGFCMWDTNQTAFNIMNTPYKKDILRTLSYACHKRGIPLCLYYSVADWNHKNYPNLGRYHELSNPEPGDQPDWDKYMEFLKAQIKELCSNYGDIHGIWWDMNVPKYYDPTVNSMIRKLQPKAVINDRGFDEGDFSTPERDYQSNERSQVFKGPTEACQSVDSLSWGYNKTAEYYSDKYLLNSIDRDFAANANYLLNVGPTSEGLIPAEACDILRRIGKWYEAVKESFQNVLPVTRLITGNEVAITRRDQIFYIHFNKPVISDGFSLKPINVLPKRATLLNDGRSIECILGVIAGDYPDEKKYLRLQNLPVNELPNTVLIVKLEFNEKLV